MGLTPKQELDGLDWARISEELVEYVYYRAKVRPLPAGFTADDVVNEAVARLYRGNRKWDSEAKPNIIPHLKLIIKSILSDKGLYGLGAVKVIARGEQIDEELAETGKETEPPWLEKGWDLLLAELKGDQDAIDVIEAVRGFKLNKASEIAELLGCDIKRVYEARRRIKAAAPALMKAMARTSGGGES